MKSTTNIENADKSEHVLVGSSLVMNNLHLLEHWSKSKCKTVLFDSTSMGLDDQLFRKNIIGHENLYFIMIDSK